MGQYAIMALDYGTFETTNRIEDGLDFILSHLEEPVWPRTIFTKTLGKQYTLYNKETALARFKQSNLLDCRINAYSEYIPYRGINRQAPTIIFIDIDKSLFRTDREFWIAIQETCKNIEQALKGKPTVLWSGNGVHVCQPVQAIVLERESIFAQFEQPSQTFLKFAAQSLSNHKSDANNNPAFKSCLLRIPGSYNSKYIEQNEEIAEVKIIQRWDGIRPKINPLLYDFYIYLADKKLKELNNIGKNQAKSFRGNPILWIEKLLQIPIDDYRKTAVSLIMAPYLINIKRLSYDNASSLINSWLSKCGELRRLDSNFNYIVKYALKNSLNGEHKPIRFETLRQKNKILYDILRQTELKGIK